MLKREVLLSQYKAKANVSCLEDNFEWHGEGKKQHPYGRNMAHGDANQTTKIKIQVSLK